MLPARGRNLSYMSTLYDQMVPKGHKLRETDAKIDVSFIRALTKNTYSEFYGRPAHEPEVLFRLLLLQTMYCLSDERVIEETQVNMAYKWFVGLNIEDPLPDPSALSRFRRDRLGCSDVNELLVHVAKRCVELGLVQSGTLLIDSTHTLANTKKRDPLQVLKDAAKRLYKAICKDYPHLKEQLPKRPQVKARRQEEDPEGTKQMLHYLAELGEAVGKLLPEPNAKVAERIEIANRIVEDERLLSYKGIASAIDPDARLGYKSVSNSFFGYKEHIAVTEEGIITAVVTTPGSANDGHQLPELLDKSMELIKVDEVLADTAYSGKENLHLLHEKNIKAVMPLGAAVLSGMRKPDDGFVVSEDQEHATCPAGHSSYGKRMQVPKGKNNPRLMFFFDIEVCKVCPMQEGCYKPGSKSKSYSIRILCEEHQRQLDYTKTEEYKERSRQRPNVERKHAEAKMRHGMARARYKGLLAMHLQAILTAFVMNAKRMIVLMRAKEAKVAAIKG